MRMNINEIIKSVNVEKPLENVVAGEGTFQEILNKVNDGTIYPLTNNAGDIVGIGVETGKVGAEDSIEQKIFEKRYSCKPVMSWALAAFKSKFGIRPIAEVNETKDYVEVVYADGEVETISGYKSAAVIEKESLPDSVKIEYDELPDDFDEDDIREYLREAYDHYLAKGCELEIDDPADNDTGVITVSGIEWGRKR